MPRISWTVPCVTLALALGSSVASAGREGLPERQRAKAALEQQRRTLAAGNAKLRGTLGIATTTPPVAAAPRGWGWANLVFEGRALARDTRAVQAAVDDLAREQRELTLLGEWIGGAPVRSLDDASHASLATAAGLRRLHLRDPRITALGTLMRERRYTALRVPETELGTTPSQWSANGLIHARVAITDGRLKRASQRVGMGWHEEHRFSELPEHVDHQLTHRRIDRALGTLTQDALDLSAADFSKKYVLHLEPERDPPSI